MDTKISTIEKNANEEIRVSLTEFKGHDLIDIRVYATPAATGEAVPTRKGLCVKPELLSDLIAALQDAEAQARKAGLLAKAA